MVITMVFCRTIRLLQGGLLLVKKMILLLYRTCFIRLIKKSRCRCGRMAIRIISVTMLLLLLINIMNQICWVSRWVQEGRRLTIHINCKPKLAIHSSSSIETKHRKLGFSLKTTKTPNHK